MSSSGQADVTTVLAPGAVAPATAPEPEVDAEGLPTAPTVQVDTRNGPIVPGWNDVAPPIVTSVEGVEVDEPGG